MDNDPGPGTVIAIAENGKSILLTSGALRPFDFINAIQEYKLKCHP